MSLINNIDFVLRYLNERNDKRSFMDSNKILLNTEHKYSININTHDFEQIISKLIREHHLEVNSNNKNEYIISFDGSVLIESGGYRNLINRTRKLDVLVVIAHYLSFFVGLMMLFQTMYYLLQLNNDYHCLSVSLISIAVLSGITILTLGVYLIRKKV